MSNNSFAENFNDCVTGFPIASVAAHMVLQEGLLKDIGKVGALAGLGYLGYNYGDRLGKWANDAGEALGLNDTDGDNPNTNFIGRSLSNAHEWTKAKVQDSYPGQFFNLGGTEAAKRQAINAGAEEYATNSAAAMQSKINDIYKNSSLTPMQQKEQADAVKEQFKQAGQQYGEQQWAQSDKNPNRVIGPANVGTPTNTGTAGTPPVADNSTNKSLQQPAVQTGVGKSLHPNTGNVSGVVKTTGNLMSPSFQTTPAQSTSQQNQQGATAAPTTQTQPAPKPEVKLQFDYNKYNQQAQAIPAGAEFGTTAPENNLIPQQQSDGQATSGALRQAEQQTGTAAYNANIAKNPGEGYIDKPAPGMQLKATPEATNRLVGQQPSFAAGTNANLSNVQNPVFRYRSHQDLNKPNFDTQNQLKQTTLGGQFTQNQQPTRPSPFGPKPAQTAAPTQRPTGMQINPQRFEGLHK